MMTGIQIIPPDKSYETQLAEQLMGRGNSSGPVYSPLQGIGNIANTMTGAYMMKQQAQNQQDRQQALTSNLQAAVHDSLKPDGTVDNMKLGQALLGNQETAGMGMQLISQAQKNQTQYRTLSADEVKAKGLDTSYQYQQDLQTGQISTLGGRAPDPAKMSNYFNTKGYDNNGNLVTVRKATDESGKVHIIDTSPIPPKPMDAQSSKEQAGLVTLAGVSQAMRGLAQSPGFNWNGPVSGPLAMKFQQYGLNPNMTNQQAFATLEAHYTPMFMSILGGRAGVTMLKRMDELRPNAAYPVSRNIDQLNATDGVVNSYAKELAGNFAGAGYNIDPRLIALGKKSGFDPNNASTASADFLPSVPASQGGGQVIPDGATATGPNGHKIVYKGGNWLDAQTGAPIGQ